MMTCKLAPTWALLMLFVATLLASSSPFIREVELREVHLYASKSNLIVNHLFRTTMPGKKRIAFRIKKDYSTVSIVPLNKNSKPLRQRVLSFSHKADIPGTEWSPGDSIASIAGLLSFQATTFQFNAFIAVFEKREYPREQAPPPNSIAQLSSVRLLI